MPEISQQQVRRLFMVVAELPEAERQAALTRACEGDPALRMELDALLRAARDAGAFLASPGGAGSREARRSADAASAEQPGMMIGRYKLLERIGEGGFGEVWMAEQREPVKRRVALKIIKLGMDTKQVIARFEAERQALAMMVHPHIAKVLDAGATETGRPYFVMEYIKGIPILEYCDKERLDTKARLGLFTSVCHAIQHAHQKGIIHRDIKPSNVLVTMHDGVPVPMVIDFGIAKATNSELTSKTLFTEHRQMIGTPAYMSPEQAEMSGLDIDTRSDIYSLGVLLYELLTGTTPFDMKALLESGFAEMMRVIREVDPHKPSTRISTLGNTAALTAQQRHAVDGKKLGLILRGDLDWIVMKCLEKDRARRYETANGLAADIKRHLSDEPVVAGPPSARYRLQKFVKRNRGQVIAAGVVAGALVLGIVGTTWGFIDAASRAKGERLAKVEANEKRRLAEAKTAEAEAARAAEVAARETIECNAYVANVEMAAAAIDFRQFDRVHARLDACPARLRGWEWRWLSAAADTSVVRLTGHTDPLESAALSPDGSRVVTASWDKTARVWDARTGASLLELEGHTDTVAAAAFSPDGTRILTASHDKTARLWDAATGVIIIEFKANAGVHSAAFSPDGTRIVTVYESETARVWDAATGAGLVELRGHTGPVGSAAFSPDGTRVVTASWDRTARVWDAVTGASLAELKGHTWVVTSAAFSPDGSRIVTASWDKTARVWDARSGASLLELKGHTERASHAAFSPDGTRIVTASWDDSARVWDADSGAEVFQIWGHESVVKSAAFSKDGTRIVTASWDGSARVWDVRATLGPLVLTGHTAWVTSVGFSPDGTRIVTTSNDQTARVWDAVTGASLTELTGLTTQVLFAAFSPDGTRIVTASRERTPRVWDARTGACLVELKGHTELVYSATFSPDGARILTASEDGTARVWDAGSGASRVELEGHTEPICSASFSPDGARILTASRDKSARVWDAWSGTSLVEFKGHTDEVRSGAFSPDGTRIVTASHDRTARVWDAATGATLVVLKGHRAQVSSAAFSPDGTRIVTASGDQTARVWDAATGVTLAELKGHTGWVGFAAFSPDGTRIATASEDRTVRVWDSVTYRERFPALERARRASARIGPLVQARLGAGETAESILAAVGADTTLAPEERTAAQAEVWSWGQPQRQAAAAARAEATRLNTVAWPAVRFAPVAPDAARQALADAQRAVELAPGDAMILNTLGVALYRDGQIPEALDKLTRSEVGNSQGLDGPQPADWAFIAMARWKLGRVEDARAALATLRELATKERWKNDDETVRWLKEAETLIAAAR